MKIILGFLTVFFTVSVLLADTFVMQVPVSQVKEVYKTYTKEKTEIIPCYNDTPSSNQGSSNVLGTVISGAIGGVIGSQVGKGKGKTAATIGGTVLGTIVGNKLMTSKQEKKCYRTVLRTYQVLMYSNIAYLNNITIEKITKEPLKFIKVNVTF